MVGETSLASARAASSSSSVDCQSRSRMPGLWGTRSAASQAASKSPSASRAASSSGTTVAVGQRLPCST